MEGLCGEGRRRISYVATDFVIVTRTNFLL